MSEIKLKPCPFCGGPGYLCQIPSASGGDRYIWVAKCSVEDGCGVEFLGCSRKADAVKEWNTRILEPDNERLKALKKEVAAANKGAMTNAKVNQLMADRIIDTTKRLERAVEALTKLDYGHFGQEVQDITGPALKAIKEESK